jgi:hypothetical protein
MFNWIYDTLFKPVPTIPFPKMPVYEHSYTIKEVECAHTKTKKKPKKTKEKRSKAPKEKKKPRTKKGK